MVGGTVHTVYHKDDYIEIVVQGVRTEHNDCIHIKVVWNDLPIRRGDSIWWQDRTAYWTPQDRSRQDVPIDRIGYSFGFSHTTEAQP
jgi:hypothetical protein